MSCAVGRCPAGTAAVLRRPTTPRTIGFQRFAAPLTGSGTGGARSRRRTLAGRSEQFVRRATGRPAGTDHPTDQLRTRNEHVGRRDGRDGLREQRTHFRDVAVTHSAQQLGGRHGARIETGLRVAHVRTQGFDLGDRRPGRSRRLRTPPLQPRQRDRHSGAAACETQLLERQRRTHPILAQRSSPNHQRLPGRTLLHQDTRHVGRSHSTKTLTCASSDNAVDHAFAPSDRFTPAPFVRRNEMLLDCNVTPGRRRRGGCPIHPTRPAAEGLDSNQSQDRRTATKPSLVTRQVTVDPGRQRPSADQLPDARAGGHSPRSSDGRRS